MEKKFVVGVDIGGQTTKIGIVDRNGNIIPDEKLDETVIDCELYYLYINSIRERFTEVDDEDDCTEEKLK